MICYCVKRDQNIVICMKKLCVLQGINCSISVVCALPNINRLFPYFQINRLSAARRKSSLHHPEPHMNEQLVISFTYTMKVIYSNPEPNLEKHACVKKLRDFESIIAEKDLAGCAAGTLPVWKMLNIY